METEPLLADSKLDQLKVELEKLTETVREKVSLRVDVIKKIHDAITAWLDKKANKMIDRARMRGDRSMNVLYRTSDSKIGRVKAELDAELASMRDVVSRLNAELFSAKDEIKKLEPLAKKWRLNK